MRGSRPRNPEGASGEFMFLSDLILEGPLTQQPQKPLLRMEHITKTFSGATVLDDVSFEVRPGEVHALIGENGAGKSTLMKIVTGLYEADAGQVFWKGEPVHVTTPHQALRGKASSAISALTTK